MILHLSTSLWSYLSPFTALKSTGQTRCPGTGRWGGSLWGEGAALCWTQTPAPIPSHPSVERGRSWEWRSEHQPWEEQERGGGKQFPLFLRFSPYFTTFPQSWVCFAHNGNCWVSLFQLLRFSILFFRLFCLGREERKWQTHRALWLHTNLKALERTWTLFNLGYDMCKHLEDLSPSILHLMKSLTVTLICKSIKSFLMSKT